MIGNCDNCDRHDVPVSSGQFCGCDTTQCFTCQGDVPDPYGELEPEAMTATILPFPPQPARPAPSYPRTRGTMRHVTLLRLTSDAIFATAGFLPGDPGAPWAWIQETVAAEVGCSEEDVHVLETEEDGDVITADGIPICRVAL